MADMIPRLREMAESPQYALRRGVLLVAAQHIEELAEKLDSANHDCKELLKERTDYVAENKRLREVLEEVEAVACGETQIESDGSYDDSDGMKWIYDRIQSFKGE